MSGHLYVPTGSLGLEGFIYQGHAYTYFGLFPSLLRIPIFLFTHSLDGKLTGCSLLLAWLLTGLFTSMLLWRTRVMVRGGALMGRVEAATFGVLIAAQLGGSVLVYLAANPWVFSEDKAWSVALSVGAIFTLLGVLERPSWERVTVCGLIILATALTRAVEGYACILGAVLVASWFAFSRSARTAKLVATDGRHRGVGNPRGIRGELGKIGRARGAAGQGVRGFSRPPPESDQWRRILQSSLLPDRFVVVSRTDRSALHRILPVHHAPRGTSCSHWRRGLLFSRALVQRPGLDAVAGRAHLRGAGRCRATARQSRHCHAQTVACRSRGRDRRGPVLRHSDQPLSRRLPALLVPGQWIGTGLPVVEVGRAVSEGLLVRIRTDPRARRVRNRCERGYRDRPNFDWTSAQATRYVEAQRSVGNVLGSSLSDRVLRGDQLPAWAPADSLFVAGDCSGLYLSNGERPVHEPFGETLHLNWLPVEEGKGYVNVLDGTFGRPDASSGRGLPVATIGASSVLIHSRPNGPKDVSVWLTVRDPQFPGTSRPEKISTGSTAARCRTERHLQAYAGALRRWQGALQRRHDGRRAGGHPQRPQHSVPGDHC